MVALSPCMFRAKATAVAAAVAAPVRAAMGLAAAAAAADAAMALGAAPAAMGAAPIVSRLHFLFFALCARQKEVLNYGALAKLRTEEVISH
jgi:hypothetical protein